MYLSTHRTAPTHHNWILVHNEPGFDCAQDGMIIWRLKCPLRHPLQSSSCITSSLTMRLSLSHILSPGRQTRTYSIATLQTFVFPASYIECISIRIGYAHPFPKHPKRGFDRLIRLLVMEDDYSVDNGLQLISYFMLIQSPMKGESFTTVFCKNRNIFKITSDRRVLMLAPLGEYNTPVFSLGFS